MPTTGKLPSVYSITNSFIIEKGKPHCLAVFCSCLVCT